MTPDDILYSPISNPFYDQLKKLVKKIRKNPSDKRLVDSVASDIVDLCRRHGITQEDKMVDQVFDAIADLEGKDLVQFLTPQSAMGHLFLVQGG